MKRWLAITIRIPDELKDALSNFLFEEGATGIEEVDEDKRWKIIKTYFPGNRKIPGIIYRIRQYIKSINGILPNVSRTEINATYIQEKDWSENWRNFFKPIHVTSRFVIIPPWSRIRQKKNQIPIIIHPGMAFGTGSHPTTKLCIRALEKILVVNRSSVLDVGTGSGILSIVAAKLGAKEVLGLDIDSTAIENARENVRMNKVSDIVRIRKERIGKIDKRFDVIVANIDFRNLRRMRWSLINHLKKEGVLILSGILMEEKDRIYHHYIETNHFQKVKISDEEGWTCLIFKRLRS